MFKQVSLKITCGSFRNSSAFFITEHKKPTGQERARGHVSHGSEIFLKEDDMDSPALIRETCRRRKIRLAAGVELNRKHSITSQEDRR